MLGVSHLYPNVLETEKVDIRRLNIMKYHDVWKYATST
jgi:hypothetical protein